MPNTKEDKRPEHLGIKMLILWPLGLSAAIRGYSLLPYRNVETPPAPLVFHNTPWAPWVFSIAWIVVGLLTIFAAVYGHRIVVFSPGYAVAKLRLDDIAILGIVLMTSIWGISYEYSWITSLFTDHPNRDYVSGRNFVPWAIATFGSWYYWFIKRTELEVITGEAEESLPHPE